MANWRYVDFSVKGAQWLADLEASEMDLKTAEEICDLFLNKRQESEESVNPETLVLFEAMCTAAIVRYGRSFVSGVRKEVPVELINKLPQEQQEAHSYFMNLRHKWVAHSVNTFEDVQVVAYLTPEERGPMNVSSISVIKGRIATLGVQEMMRLKKLTVTVRGEISKVIEEEKQNVLLQARSLPPEQFYNQVDPPRKFFVHMDARRTRKKF